MFHIETCPKCVPRFIHSETQCLCNAYYLQCQHNNTRKINEFLKKFRKIIITIDSNPVVNLVLQLETFNVPNHVLECTELEKN